jgi:hypothetical protein
LTAREKDVNSCDLRLILIEEHRLWYEFEALSGETVLTDAREGFSCADLHPIPMISGTFHKHLLKCIAACPVGNRPGRLEPRVIKRRRHAYPLM